MAEDVDILIVLRNAAPPPRIAVLGAASSHMDDVVSRFHASILSFGERISVAIAAEIDKCPLIALFPGLLTNVCTTSGANLPQFQRRQNLDRDRIHDY